MAGHSMNINMLPNYNMQVQEQADTHDPALLLQMRLAQYQALILEAQQPDENPAQRNSSFKENVNDNVDPSDSHRNTQHVDVVSGAGGSGGKHARYTAEQVHALERLFSRCPKPTPKQRQELLLDCPSLRNVDPYQIKVWFQNRRCREKKIKESSRLQVLNGQLNAMNSALMNENAQLRQQMAQLLQENNVLRHHLNINVNTSAANYMNNSLQPNYNSYNSCSTTSVSTLSPTPTPSPPSQRTAGEQVLY